MNITTNLTLNVQNNSQKISLSDNSSGTPSGSNCVGDTITLTTSSWYTIPTGSNKDLWLGSYTNNDTVDNIYIGVGTTGSIAAILTPTWATVILPYSGSVQVYAHLSGSNPNASFSYTQVSFN